MVKSPAIHTVFLTPYLILFILCTSGCFHLLIGINVKEMQFVMCNIKFALGNYKIFIE